MTSERAWLPIRRSGRVFCARRGEEVELLRCLGCNWLEDLDRATGRPAVRCAAADPVFDARIPVQCGEPVD